MFGILMGGLACGAEQVRAKAGGTRVATPPPEPAAGPTATAVAGMTAPAARTEAASGAASEALAVRARALGEKLGERGFTVLVEPPFVVAGDESAEKVAHRAATTIRWSVRRLKEAYFKKDPTEIIEVYLFRDATSYRHHAKELFDEVPESPYGYYAPAHDVLLMNISTGGGTLVHEIVHPYIRANFPGCPSWFNEGLASLYEQCDDRNGEIVGLTNWRLPGLQTAIRGRTLRSLSDLLATSSEEFYAPASSGTNYAQARYLCHYLQEHGMLRNFYHQFVASAATDPTGRTLLVQTVGYVDIDKFDADWRQYALGLSYG